jgi:FkbM family methyltransferase
VKKHWLAACEKCGIPADRVEMRGWEMSSVSHLDWYNQVDVALDPFPYNGTTTTCEALWMGVPVITLEGQIHASRVGASLLTQVGHTEWVAKSENEYVDKAVALAQDTEKLTQIRTTLRDELKNSPLHDAKAFTKGFEASLRQMWKTWCEKPGTQVHAAQTETLPSTAVESAIEADRLSRLGQRAKAYRLACVGLMQMRNSPAHTPPQDLLVRWHAVSLGSALARMAIQSGAYSGCFDPQNVSALLGEWLRYEPGLPEPLLRIALLQARQARVEGREVPKPTLDALRLVHKVMNEPRSAKALEWASTNKFNGDFTLPYDGGEFTVYGAHDNITTFILLEQSDWFEDEITLFRSLCKPGVHMLDLGTNVGVYSYSAAQRVGPEGRVLSIEPGDKTFSILKKNTAGFDNWSAEQAAISDHSGWAHLVDTDRPELARLGESGTGQKTRLWSVDELIKERGWKRLDLIKMDVEGHEISTIKGAGETLKKFSPTVLYELKDAQRVHVELIDAFATHGYHSYAYNAIANELVRFTDPNNVDPFLLNLVAIKPERLSDFDGIVNIRM